VKGAVDGVGGTVKQDMCQCLRHDLKATINCTWLLVWVDSKTVHIRDKVTKEH